MIYERILRPLFFALDPEVMHTTMHHFSVLLGRSPAFRAYLRRTFTVDDPRLRSTVDGIDFPNPVGLAAGFDKTGEMLGAVSRVGFGFVEVGSVTRLSWPGNPRPRVFRLPADEAIINRMGLNNPGVEAVSAALAATESPVPVGVSVAKTPDPRLMGDAGVEDFVHGVMGIRDRGQYLALNVSCPNTEEGKTFEDPALLAALLAGIRKQEEPRHLAGITLFVKLSPDIDDAVLADVLAVCRRYAVAGLILGNTTTSREGLTSDPARVARIGRGGLSGRPLRERALSLVRRVYAESGGTLPIMGCGGIFSAEDAYRYLRAGASLVQVYTGMIYRGPYLMREINRRLLRLLDADNFASVGEAVGADHKK